MDATNFRASIKYWTYMKEKRKPYQPLVFIDTPHTEGNYVRKILKSLNIRSIGHNQAPVNIGTTFTVIKDPVQRVEDFVNYHIHKPEKECDALIRPFRKTTLEMNEIMNEITDQEFLNLEPFRCLAYWTRNVDVCITIDQLKAFLNFYGHEYDPDAFKKDPPLLETRGGFNQNTKLRFMNLYNRDYLIFRLWSGSEREYEIERAKYRTYNDKQKKPNRIKLEKISEIAAKFKRAIEWYDFKDVDSYFV